MTYSNCKNCNKRFYRSPYFRGEYKEYCNQCGAEKFNNENGRKLVRTDTDSEYLDSTRCEYTQEEVKVMKGAKELYLMKISKLREEIKEKYQEINRLENKISKINTKVAVAEREQHLRKKLRRETRLLLPSLQNVAKNIGNVQNNLLSTLSNGNDDNNDSSSVSSDDEFLKEASELVNKLNNEANNSSSN